MNKFFLALPVLALVAACHGNSGNNASGSTSGAQITGAGSTFVYPVLSAWAADYQKQAGTAVNYQSIGSGGGISQVEAGTVDFGATDQPLASGRARKEQSSPIPGRRRWHSSSREHRRARRRQAQAHWPDPGRHLPGQDQDLERSGDRQDQPRLEPPQLGDCCRPPLGWLWDDLQLHSLSQPGQPDLEGGTGRGQDGQLDRRRRRQGQRRRRGLCEAAPQRRSAMSNTLMSSRTR